MSEIEQTTIQKLQKENKELREKLAKTSSYVERFNMIVDNSHEWVWEVDINGVYTFASHQVKDILGYEPSELIGKTPFHFMSKKEAERVSPVFLNIVKEEKEFSKLFNTCLHKNGGAVYTETSGNPFFDKNGNLLGYRGIDFNRTQEFKQSMELEQRFTHQNQLIDCVTNSISDFLFYKDKNFIYIGCNQAFCDFVGIDMDVILGKSDYELFDKQFADIFRENDTKVIKSLKTQSNYETVVHSNGDELYLLTKKSPLINKDGELIGLVGLSRDLTKEHELEKQLKRSNDFLVDAQSLASIGHWEWDIQSGIITWSDEIYRIFGFEVDQFLPTYDIFLYTIHPEDRDLVSNAVSYSLENRTGYDIQHRIILPDGSQKMVHEIGHAIYEGDSAVSMIGTVQDISKIKKVENKLKELVQELDNRVSIQSSQLIKQSKMAQMGELLSMIAHQWRQPLSAIAAVAVNVKMKIELSKDNESKEELYDYTYKQMQDISDYVQSLSRTINDFRNLYKSDKKLSELHIIEPINNALKLISVSLNEHNIKVVTCFNASDKINIQDNEIMQVILNLLKNAQDNFLEKNIENPKININTIDIGEYIRVEICDNGGGIKNDILENIFDPYFSTKDEKNGTGLGLYMCKLIVEQNHKGRLDAMNINGGVCFSIDIPKNIP